MNLPLIGLCFIKALALYACCTVLTLEPPPDAPIDKSSLKQYSICTILSSDLPQNTKHPSVGYDVFSLSNLLYNPWAVQSPLCGNLPTDFNTSKHK